MRFNSKSHKQLTICYATQISKTWRTKHETDSMREYLRSKHVCTNLSINLSQNRSSCFVRLVLVWLRFRVVIFVGLSFVGPCFLASWLALLYSFIFYLSTKNRSRIINLNYNTNRNAKLKIQHKLEINPELKNRKHQ